LLLRLSEILWRSILAVVYLLVGLTPEGFLLQWAYP
jgi:hypothetical protein